jgi:hypothetical protein
MGIGLAFLLFFVLLFFAVQLLIPIGAAVDSRARNGTAAASAALAGADAVARYWVEVSAAPGVLRYGQPPVPPPADTGAAAAAALADANGSSLTAYAVLPESLDVVARIGDGSTYDGPVYGGVAIPAGGEATASLPVDPAACAWQPGPLPPAGAPPVFDRTLTCGEWSATYRIVNDGATYPTQALVGVTPEELLARLEPQLSR